MSIQDLGALGEFIASVGVVVSLIYLGLQTKENTRSMRAQTRSSITDQILNIQTSAFLNEKYQGAMRKLGTGDAITEEEAGLLRAEALMYFKHMENAQFQYEQGLYDEDEYLAQRRTWAHRFRDHQSWREAWIFFKDRLSPRLVVEVEAIMADIDSEETGS